MGVFKSQFTRALNVIPSANCNIPYPNAIVSSTTTDSSPNNLIDSSVDFIALNVQAGDIVYNISANQAATVAGVIDSTTLSLNADIAPPGDDYVVYQASSQTGLGNTGAFLLFSAAATAVITTIGSDELTVGASVGVLPIQVLKLTSTSGGATVTALW
jgi:hypothetical protein